MATGYWVSRAVYVVAQLGIADLLKEEAQDAEALATATGTYAPALRRVLRSLASVGLFRTDAQGRFRAVGWVFLGSMGRGPPQSADRRDRHAEGAGCE
jgi:hypothetical protein